MDDLTKIIIAEGALAAVFIMLTALVVLLS